MNVSREPRQFGKRENRIVISSNGSVREYRISAQAIVIATVLFAMFMTGYIGATAYLAFREDLVAGTLIRQARMKHEYEDRIAALRAEVDRITSRQLLDQQAVEAKVAALMHQQEQLTGRNGALDGLLEKARKKGLDIPLPEETENGDRAQLETSPVTDSLTTGTVAGASAFGSGSNLIADMGSLLRGSTIGGESSEPLNLELPGMNTMQNNRLAAIGQAATGTSSVFGSVKDQIRSIEARQMAGLVALQDATRDRMEKVAGIYKDLNVALPEEVESGIGGPFIPSGDVAFDDLAENIATSLDILDNLKQKTGRLPVANPVPGAALSSTFGNRIDPFRKTSAFHAGLDFRATTGTAVHATGAGRVIHAGRKGGYGLMVEIDHGGGITSRYAHLSRISVKQGETVTAGKVVGKVGSTGRSTGPHLHYEIRRHAKATNPARFLKAGRKLGELL